jgi:hypothetical protein
MGFRRIKRYIFQSAMPDQSTTSINSLRSEPTAAATSDRRRHRKAAIRPMIIEGFDHHAKGRAVQRDYSAADALADCRDRVPAITGVNHLRAATAQKRHRRAPGKPQDRPRSTGRKVANARKMSATASSAGDLNLFTLAGR